MWSVNVYSQSVLCFFSLTYRAGGFRLTQRRLSVFLCLVSHFWGCHTQAADFLVEAPYFYTSHGGLRSFMSKFRGNV